MYRSSGEKCFETCLVCCIFWVQLLRVEVSSAKGHIYSTRMPSMNTPHTCQADVDMYRHSDKCYSDKP